MATNLRLRAESEAALRAEADRTGRSQQDLIREAIDVALGLTPAGRDARARDGRRADPLAAAGIVPARTSFAQLAELIELPSGVTSTGLLDRADRV